MKDVHGHFGLPLIDKMKTNSDVEQESFSFHAVAFVASHDNMKKYGN